METDKAIFEKMVGEERRAARRVPSLARHLPGMSRPRARRTPSPARRPARPRARPRHDHDAGRTPDVLEVTTGASNGFSKTSRCASTTFHRGVLRHRAHGGAIVAVLPLGCAFEGEESRQVLYLIGAGRLGQELVGRAAAAGIEELTALSTRSTAARCRRSRRRASAAAPPAARVREDARRAHRGRRLSGLPVPPQGGVRYALRRGRGPDRHHSSRSATASASAWSRRSIRTTRTRRC